MKYFKNPFTPARPTHDSLFVNREGELSSMLSWLSGGHGVLVITGERGIGKSSLALKASDLAKSEAEQTHVLYTSVYKFHARSFDVLLPELALEICVSVWQAIFGGTFSELYEGSLPSAGKAIESKHVSTIKRIYNILKAASTSARTSYLRSLGGKVIIEGKLEEKDERDISRKELTVYEFLSLIDELKALCERYGKNRIAVIADECNYLNDTEQKGFLQDFFEVLNSRKILIALIGVDLEPRTVPGFEQCVEKLIQLGPFPSTNYTRKLIHEGILSSSDMKFFKLETLNDARIERIHETCRGSPRIIQELCYELFENLYESRCDELNDDSLETTIARYEQRRIEYEERIRMEMKG